MHLDKNRVLWAKYALPRFNGHPDKTLSPEGAVKSGSDCNRGDFVTKCSSKWDTKIDGVSPRFNGQNPFPRASR